MFVLSLAGCAVAGYLTLAHLNQVPFVCPPAFESCDLVAHHPSAHGFGIPQLAAIPTAAFGAAMYVIMLALCVLRRRVLSLTHYIGAAEWGMVLIALGISGYLTYLEAAVIHAWCPWCLVSAGIVVGMFVTLTIEAMRFRRVAASVHITL